MPVENEITSHLLPILDRVSRVQPVGVLKLYSFPLQGVRVHVQLGDGALEVLAVDEDVLLLGEEVRHVVEDEEHALVLVGAHQDVRLLELLPLQGDSRLLVKEGPINDGGEDADGQPHCNTVPLLVHL